MSSKEDLLNKHFSHIYVEEKVRNHKDVKAILERFNSSIVIPINHYKDVFNRPRQDVNLQAKSRSLILASNDGTKLFKGAPVCQDFGYDNFMYSASVQGCIYNCDYCFLKGMYGTGNVVVFVNFEDYEKAVIEECHKKPLYLCTSYDTDLQALNSIINYSDRWAELAVNTPELTVEIRTKAANVEFKSHERVIYAFSISPEEIIRRFEHGTASFERRIQNVEAAIEKNCQVRLCFDPMVYINGWENIYSQMIDTIISRVDMSKIKDISIGTVRISGDYLKKFRKISPDSAAVQFPFEKEDGYCVYPKDLREKMTGLLVDKLEEVYSHDRIYCE